MSKGHEKLSTGENEEGKTYDLSNEAPAVETDDESLGSRSNHSNDFPKPPQIGELKISREALAEKATRVTKSEIVIGPAEPIPGMRGEMNKKQFSEIKIKSNPSEVHQDQRGAIHEHQKQSSHKKSWWSFPSTNFLGKKHAGGSNEERKGLTDGDENDGDNQDKPSP